MQVILAIDLGKFNSVLCWFTPDTRESAFRTVATTPRRAVWNRRGVTVSCHTPR